MNKKKNTYIRQRNRKRRTLIVLCFLILVAIFGVAKFAINKNKKDIQTVEKKSQEENLAAENIKKEEPKPDEIIKGSNVTVEGDKYAYDATEVEDVLTKGKYKVDGKKIAFLTFDDGPSTTVTPKILDILKENEIKGTFFIVGNSLDRDESKELLKRTIKEGHAIANHTVTHNYKKLYPGRVVNVENFMGEVEKNDQMMRDVLGENFHSRVIRFPGGHMSWKGTKEVDKVLKEKGYLYIDWNSLTGDAEGKKRTPVQLAERVKTEVNEKNGEPDRLVVLMHDTYGKETTAEALQDVINYLKSLGYEFKTLK
ncbi:polysaccharide deacetylase family protein [Clostridium fallax]|uniref:Peptidoglycan/xylan/chitin deacetylase, PgdA/CDA1 family n=1 Tax=Clostridium fallax TaxID=1533 RepID=A0A1M4WEG1_9CLOT|nr:polysaccharide deacetylase family protein [Clostridium fallax]SHE79540.1 Peptidoglycan/xylan/chitin deacetylase, PgdA/CDA1 family [Clostridium fallax]SQB22228.1 polysaccharide deacetylase [Clostridium fallax]